MKHLDDLFRDGLSGRKGEVPADMWSKIQASGPLIPSGEALDRQFADGLGDREAPVPIGMWGRIAAARAATRNRAYYLGAAALLLLLLGFAWWQWGTRGATPTPAPTIEEPIDAGVAAAPGETTRTAPVTHETLEEAITSRVATTAPSQTASIANLLPPEVPTTEADLSSEEVPTDLLPTTKTGLATSALPIIPIAAVVSSLPEVKEVISDLPAIRSGPATATFRRAPRHRSQTEMLFGAAYANQMLSAGGTQNRSLLAARENSEFPELSFQITLRQTYRITDRMTLRAGFTYVDLRNQFDYEEVVDNRLTLVRRNNHIRMLEVPVLAGLSIPGKRLSVTLNAGPVFNLVTAAQGNYLDPADPELRDLRRDGKFRNYTGVGYMASLTTSYVIGNRDPFVLVLEPFFKHYPGSFTAPSAPIQEKYWLAGLQLGVRKSL